MSEPREDAPKPEVRRAPWIQRSRVARIWLPVAASALVVVGLSIWRGQNRPPNQSGRLPGGGEELRGGVPALVLLEPVGPIADSPKQFRWTRHPEAASYRVELFDQDAKRIGVAVTADTTLAIEALSHQPINAGQWRVMPLGANGLELPRHVRAVFVVAR